MTQVLQTLLHSGRVLVASVDDLGDGILILPTFSKNILALVHRLGDGLGAGGEVAGLENLHSCLCLAGSLPAGTSWRSTQLCAVVAHVGDDGPVVQASIHLRHVGQREPGGVAGGLDVDVALLKDLGQVGHPLRSCI